MSALDDMALSDEALEAWMAAKTNPRPLVRSMSALDGFVTASVTGPRFADPQDWMCPLMGLPRDVLAKGSATDHAVFASLARIHNRINETLFDRPQDYAPRFATKPGGGIDPRPWCQGFYAAMNLNIKRWKRLLDLNNPNHGLLLPILIYCVDKKGRPVLGKPRPGPDTAHFIEHEAYKDIALVIPALRELHYVTRYGDPQ
ncbi:yecA family protein [Mesorhizobium shonense]|uniref:YecA family protein n=1 Tax=Mesorhizobium shonense TaxID=1209948 RepID=A0ABV2I5B5_9HYPH